MLYVSPYSTNELTTTKKDGKKGYERWRKKLKAETIQGDAKRSWEITRFPFKCERYHMDRWLHPCYPEKLICLNIKCKSHLEKPIHGILPKIEGRIVNVDIIIGKIEGAKRSKQTRQTQIKNWWKKRHHETLRLYMIETLPEEAYLAQPSLQAQADTFLKDQWHRPEN